MSLGSLEKIVLLCCIACLMLGGVFGYGCHRGHISGAASIQAKWDADKAAAREAQDLLVQQLAKEEATHAERQNQVAQELVHVRDTAARDLAVQRAVYEQRLLQSSRRGEIYRSQAEAGSAACSDLASHAAKLDRALEQGRDLVGELRESLGLRDRQVVLLGEQIMTDRRLVAGDEVSR